MEVRLRAVEDDDLDVFWGFYSDPELQHMAGVTREYFHQREAFDRHWQRVRAAPEALNRTIVLGGQAVGHIAAFGPRDEREVAYVVGRPFWGRGIATAALRQLLDLEPSRPLHAGAAADNLGSIRVLEKCGFAVTGRDRDGDPSMARGGEVDIVLLTLHGAPGRPPVMEGVRG